MTESTRKSASGGHQEANRKSPAQIDWPAVERDYRTSQMTLRELGAKYGCDHAAIARRAKREGWQRDLTEAVKQATNAKLIEASVNNAVNKAVTSEQQAVTNTVLAAAEVNTQVILGHRKGLREITAVRNLLLGQVAEAAANLPDLAEVIEMVRNQDDNGVDKANDAMRKAMNRSSLIDDLKKLAEVDERVRKGEREAFGIGPATDDPAGRPQKRVVLDFVEAVIK